MIGRILDFMIEAILSLMQFSGVFLVGIGLMIVAVGAGLPALLSALLMRDSSER